MYTENSKVRHNRAFSKAKPYNPTSEKSRKYVTSGTYLPFLAIDTTVSTCSVYKKFIFAILLHLPKSLKTLIFGNVQIFAPCKSLCILSGWWQMGGICHHVNTMDICPLGESAKVIISL